MRTGHLFAGAGGGIYADLILGREPVFAVEWDGYAANILKERVEEGWFPDMHVHHGDVRMFDPSPWQGRVDSLHAGFPCVDISVAGAGAGIDGENSGLWSEVVRVAGDLRPRELFLENSPAITSRGLGRVLGDLAELGYDAQWCILSAAAVGAPHLRARWWCLAKMAGADSERCGEARRFRSAQESGPGGVREEVSDAGHTIVSRDTTGGFAGNTGCKHISEEWEKSTSNAGSVCGMVADPGCKRSQGHVTEPSAGEERLGAGCDDSRWRDDWWQIEPGLGRVAHGVADRGNRIRALGNGQVPLQAAAAYLILAENFGADLRGVVHAARQGAFAVEGGPGDRGGDGGGCWVRIAVPETT